MMRRGLTKGSGKKGYYNVIGKDPMVHSQSARGIKQPQRLGSLAYFPELKNKEPYWCDICNEHHPANHKCLVKMKGGKGSDFVTEKEEKMVSQFIKDFLEKENKKMNKYTLSKYQWFDDVDIISDKEMDVEYNQDASKGWTGSWPFRKTKQKDSNVVAIISFDSDLMGLDSYGNGGTPYRLEQALKKRFKGKYELGYYSAYNIQVYKDTGDST